MDEQLPPPRPIPRLRFFVALSIVAVSAALFACVFRAASTLLFQRAMHAPDVLVAFQRLPLYARVLLPTLGGGVAGILAERAVRTTGGHSVGDVMEAVALGGVRPSIGAASLKALGSWVAIVTGMSVGREGPLVQFGGALGSKVGTVLRISDRRTRALTAAGIGAGFAAAYNTPLAAVLFVVEVFTGVTALSIVLPTLIAVALATALTRAFVGDGPIYGQRAFAMRTPWELGAHLILGVLGGLAGVVFMRLLTAGERLFGRIRRRPVRAAVGGALVGSLACALPTVTGNGYEAIALILGGGIPFAVLLLLVLAKPLATSISVGSGSPGGVFTPSLFLGAALGALVAGLLGRVAPAIGPAGGYALVGMASVVAATTHAPLMSAVLVFELSGDYAIVLPLLVAVSVANAVSRALHPSSIYMQELERKGVRWRVGLEGREVERGD